LEDKAMNEPQQGDDANDQVDVKAPPSAIGTFFAGVLVFIAVFCINIGLIVIVFKGNLQESGQFGDSFGVVTSTFSGLALAGAIYALVLQRRELSDQRVSQIESRRDQRRMAELQAQMAAAQTKTAELQSQMATAQTRLADLMLRTAQLNACGIMINHDRRISENLEIDPLHRQEAFLRLELNLMRIDILSYFHRPEASIGCDPRKLKDVE
jgi:hypothetical protein